jgi:NAD-dependent SIR2 family protein deacetylase
MKDTEALEQAAKLIRRAKRVLFLTSAGMSADSNIPTFRDKNGYWKNFPPFKEKNLEAQDLASPWAFQNVLPHAWAFYEWRRRNAHENTPHEGYSIINRWIDEHFQDGFVHTTNTDGYHLRSGLDKSRIMEIHGSMWRLQCLETCTKDFWHEPSVPLCGLDYERMIATDFPHCLNCNAIARPHILMFGDWDYVGHPEQESQFSKFIQRPVDLAILVGSSGAVPTNDYIAQRLKASGITLININLDPDSNRIASAEHFLPLKSKDAFIELDRFAFS